MEFTLYGNLRVENILSRKRKNLRLSSRLFHPPLSCKDFLLFLRRNKFANETHFG